MTKLAKKTKGAAESGDWLVLRDTASPMLFKLWQQQRVSLALALEAARILSDTDQALAGQVEDPEGYLRSQILAVQRANENRGSAAVRWALRVEYVDLPEKSGRREYETLREAEVDYNIYLTGDVPLSVFFYEVLEDGTEREIERGASPGGIDEAEGVDAARVSASEELLIDPSELTLHPAAEMFPEMTPSEFTALVDHIRVHRQQEPVVIDAQNRIIDGRHRWRACQALANQGLQVWCQRAESLGLHSEDDIREYVIAKNLHRRHLSESQRAMMAAALSANLQSGKGHTVAQAAEKLKVSPRSVASAKRVREKGSPDLVAAVEQGKVSVSAAARALDSGQLTVDSGKKKKGETTESTKGAEKKIRALRDSEYAWLKCTGFRDCTAECIDGKSKVHIFRKEISKKKTVIVLDFMHGAVDAGGGGTIGFFRRLEDAGAAIEHWQATGEFIADSMRAPEPRPKVGEQRYKPDGPVVLYFPGFIGGVTEGCPFKNPEPEPGEDEGGFDFAVLCAGVECIRTAGPAAWLSTAKPTQDQVDYLVEFLGRAVPLLGDIAKEFTERIVEE